MRRSLVVRRQVEFELNAAVDWYRQYGTEVAERFLRAFDVALDAIQRNPFQYQVIDDDVRHIVLHGFPYSIMYVVTDDAVIVLSCFHGRRDPARWHGRK